MIVVTGGSGFIGKNFILNWFKNSEEPIINIDKLTYAASEQVLTEAKFGSKYRFEQKDIADNEALFKVFNEVKPRCVINFAAETHVDRSIRNPQSFIDTNIVGTARLLEAVRSYCTDLTMAERKRFRFVHISTDEVYGSLEPHEPAFTENSRFQPNSPYAASKTSSDHLVRAYNKTYDINTTTVNCSNNYGPFQFPEKLIPLCIANALKGDSLRVYGDGKQIRDWLFVEDHCHAIRLIVDNGTCGASYNVGGDSEKQNIEVVEKICKFLDCKRPRADGTTYANLIKFVEDRPGHDTRYAVNSGKIFQELKWKPTQSFDVGLEKTIDWYLNNNAWLNSTIGEDYSSWLQLHYGKQEAL